ncbi:MAG TPA: ATP-binding protein [Bryobacteraceae bacterium]|jgi:signal transduction histidine kinase|nr:ATP-binding protein [Bryobacteraceae bacterium]
MTFPARTALFERLSLKRLSLLWRILLSTSIAITALLALAAWLVGSYAIQTSEQNLENEARTNLQVSQSLWMTRAQTLASVSRIISSMSDVRAAFSTADQATIRDTAQELWSRVSSEDAVFLVLSPTGSVIASLGGDYGEGSMLPVSLDAAIRKFPGQASGFSRQGSKLLYIVLTPVYVQSGHGEALINILLAGFEVNQKFVETLKRSTRGGDFTFVSSGQVVASTVPVAHVTGLTSPPNAAGVQRLHVGKEEYLALRSRLDDIAGQPVGDLLVLRSIGAARRSLATLQRNAFVVWFVAILIGLGCTFMLARRIVEPVRRLDRAASEVARSNYDHRLAVDSEDELGRLAKTFNHMCESLQQARQELIRHERITTIGRLASSIVHDLRNPLAAIYGGAEMLIDGGLPPDQTTRLATAIYQASRRMQDMLQDLMNSSRGKAEPTELCRLQDLIDSAYELVAETAGSNKVSVELAVPEDIYLPLQPSRMRRVFLNLMSNAIEAMPAGGSLRVSVNGDKRDVLIKIEDTGTGIPKDVRSNLFQPFATAGKANGLGLGLALLRQTVLDHHGDVWLDDAYSPGARFWVKLPRVQPEIL